LESYKSQIDALTKMVEETENILKQVEKLNENFKPEKR